MTQTTSADAPAGLTTTRAPFIEQARADGRLYIEQPYELYTAANHDVWRRRYARMAERWQRYGNASFLESDFVLGIGNRIYPNFCAAAIKVDAAFEAAGGTRMSALEQADEIAGQADTVRHWLKNASIPVMEMGAMRADPLDMNIGIDNVAAMYELTDMVIQRGYQNIGLLCANQEQWIFQQHLQGWYKAMLRHHMSPNRVINAALPANFSTGASQLPEFLLAWPELDALVCVSDELACGALYECQRRRIKVPDDLAVVGFGDSDVSRVCQPPLTTMAVPHHKIGIEAGRALLERLTEGNWSDRKPIASSLCMRDSC